ncbi:Squalene epoxidase 1 [Zea mays]|uniref:Squalene monooxygenase n=1 Tax=Zea mays TaxID=4577 RepID=A0A1D6JU96_MAIZE|nr:Squalene epoxidase 1 [Zea mays]
MAATAAAAGVEFPLIGVAVATLIVTVLVAAVMRRRRRPWHQAPLVEGKPAPEAGCAVSDGGTDVIIVGAGVAGSALAYTLGKDGRRVHVIERDLTEPDRIVGELLQPGGYLKLIELGLQDCVEEIDAQRVLGYALFKDGRNTKLAYPLEKFHSDVAGRSFHNGRFIQRMRQKAASLPK